LQKKDLDVGEQLKKPKFNRTKLMSASTLNSYQPIMTIKGTYDNLVEIQSKLKPCSNIQPYNNLINISD
jgi:hypothetical protein